MNVPDVFPEDIADQLESLFQSSTFEVMDQKVPGNFDPDEVYSARFGRCRSIEKGLRPICRSYVLPHLGSVSKWEVRAHRMLPGDHFRTHTDHRLGDLGFTICLTRGWKMDWGGLLVTEKSVSIPKFNELTIVEGVPHCVSSIETWAKGPRHMIVGFEKS